MLSNERIEQDRVLMAAQILLDRRETSEELRIAMHEKATDSLMALCRLEVPQKASGLFSLKYPNTQAMIDLNRKFPLGHRDRTEAIREVFETTS